MENQDNGYGNETTLRCPKCGWPDVRRSMPHGLLDRFTRIVGLAPFRCRTCGGRFYRAAMRETSREPVA
jgi:DNA-directed RNA polymerase subunit RPC12/RpoP